MIWLKKTSLERCQCGRLQMSDGEIHECILCRRVPSVSFSKLKEAEVDPIRILWKESSIHNKLGR